MGIMCQEYESGVVAPDGAKEYMTEPCKAFYEEFEKNKNLQQQLKIAVEALEINSLHSSTAVSLRAKDALAKIKELEK